MTFISEAIEKGRRLGKSEARVDVLRDVMRELAKLGRKDISKKAVRLIILAIRE